MPISSITEVAQEFGDYAKRSPADHALSDSNADDSAGRQAAKGKRRAQLNAPQVEAPDAGHSPAEPGKGKQIDVSG